MDPSSERIANARITDLMAYLNARLGRSIHDYDGLYKLSINEPESFWDGVWEHAELIGSRNGRTLSDHSGMQGTKFYPQSTLNFAENCLAHDAPDSQAAVISYAEAGERTELTWGELRQRVANFRNTLQTLGIQKMISSQAL